MQLKEGKVSLLVTTLGIIGSITICINRKDLEKFGSLLFLALSSSFLHFLPLLLPFFISAPSSIRRVFNGIVYLVAASLTIALLAIYMHYNKITVFTATVLCVFALASILESLLYFGKWYSRTKKKKEFKKRPLVKRRYGSGEIRMPPITVTTESTHLRAKADFIYNGSVYIRKGETVELLKPIGSYYSVRTSTGTEYIVPKENFF